MVDMRGSAGASAPPAAPLIALLSDFGTTDGYVGTMKGVILGIIPGIPLVDLSHDIAPQNVRSAAWVLHTTWRYFPDGSIFLCVVDPGVGTMRRAVAFAAGGHLFVGPDNGLFSYVIASDPPEQAVMLDNPLYHLPLPGATFHGRDIFAPCAAHLARGVALEALGTDVDPAALVTFALPQPHWRDGNLIGHVLHIDRFGNLITDIGPDLVGDIISTPTAVVHIGDHVVTTFVHTFGEGPAGELSILRDSSGHLAIALRNGSAAQALHAPQDTEVIVSGVSTASEQ